MNNYSMSAVADKLELSSHGVYANWEYGRNEPNVATLEGTHFEVIDMIKALDREDCKLVEEVLRRFRGYSFSRHLNL